MIPDNTFDVTRGFKVDDILVHNGGAYVCIDNTPSRAVWKYRSKAIKEDYGNLALTVSSLLNKLEAGDNIQFVISNDKIRINSQGTSFTDIVAMLQEGTNVTLDVDLVNEIITINSTVTPTVTYIRRSDYISADRKSYLAFAPQGSLETDAVWTITKRVGSADGTIVSNVQYFDKRWTERGLL